MAARHLEIYATGLKEAFSLRGQWDNAEKRIDAIKAEYRELRGLARFLRCFSLTRATTPTGLNPSAQGCAPGATLGQPTPTTQNPVRVPSPEAA